MTATGERTTFSILITDDDPTSRDALSEIMRVQGFTTVAAESGEEAVEIVRAGVVHLLLLDMHMPSLTGIETFFQVRQFRGLLPAILVTADPTDSVVRAAIAAQMYSVIPKPVRKPLLVSTVLKALSRFYGAGEVAPVPAS